MAERQPSDYIARVLQIAGGLTPQAIYQFSKSPDSLLVQSGTVIVGLGLTALSLVGDSSKAIGWRILSIPGWEITKISSVMLMVSNLSRGEAWDGPLNKIITIIGAVAILDASWRLWEREAGVAENIKTKRARLTQVLEAFEETWNTRMAQMPSGDSTANIRDFHALTLHAVQESKVERGMAMEEVREKFKGHLPTTEETLERVVMLADETTQEIRKSFDDLRKKTGIPAKKEPTPIQVLYNSWKR